MAYRDKGHCSSTFTGTQRLVKTSIKHTQNFSIAHKIEKEQKIKSIKPISNLEKEEPKLVTIKNDIQSFNAFFFETLNESTNYLNSLISNLKTSKYKCNLEKSENLQIVTEELESFKQSNHSSFSFN